MATGSVGMALGRFWDALGVFKLTGIDLGWHQDSLRWHQDTLGACWGALGGYWEVLGYT